MRGQGGEDGRLSDRWIKQMGHSLKAQAALAGSTQLAPS